MLLATTALLLQFLAVPNQALPVTAESVHATTAPTITSVQPEVTAAGVASEAGADTNVLSAAAEPETKAIYMPLLLPQPGAAAAAAEPVESTSSSSSSAFIRVVGPSAIEVEKERRWEQRQKRIWRALDIAQSSAATFDAWSTRRVLASGAGQELNPMLRPFAGNDSLYAVIQVAPLALDYLGHRMIMSHNKVLRHTWWIPQVAGTIVSFSGGVNNVAVYAAR
jgi:hypothetical protein